MSEPSVPEAGVPTCYRHPGRETYIRCQRCGRSICPDCMTDAAVGFQCPECIAEGRKSTRSGRAAYGGQRSSNPTQTTLALIVINAVVWLTLMVTGGRESWLAFRLMLLPTGHCGVAADAGSYYPGLDQAACAATPGTVWSSGLADGAWWMAITTGFTHLEIWHIALNLLGLWVLGPAVEAAFGRVRFLAIYLFSILCGSATVFWLADPGGSTLGASGGIFGLIGALAVLAIKVGGDLRGMLGLLAMNLVLTFTFPNISWQGHVGGLLGGAIAAALLIWSPRGERRGWWQAAGFTALGAALLVAFLTRAAMLN